MSIVYKGLAGPPLGLCVRCLCSVRVAGCPGLIVLYAIGCGCKLLMRLLLLMRIVRSTCNCCKCH